MFSTKQIPGVLLFLLLLPLLYCSIKSGLTTDDTLVKNSIRESINDYSSENWEIRLNAVKRASQYSDTVYAKNVILLMLLAADDYHPLVRIEAVKSLKKINATSALDKLRELAMDNSDLNVRRAAITALQNYALVDNADIFISGMQSEDWMIREASYIGFLRIKPDDIQKINTGKILKGINDRNISVKIAVLNNITIKDPLFYNDISGLVRNRNTKLSVLKSALVAINGYTFDGKTRKRMLELLTHRNRDVRILSLQALKREKTEMEYESDLLLH